MSKCVTWTCGELNAGVCAEWDTDWGTINSVPCPSGECSLVELHIKHGWEEAGRTYCHDQPAKSIPPVNCGVYNETKGHTNLHPIRCDEKLDCIQFDGSRSGCKCGMDGQRYCALSEADEELGYFNTFCSELDERTSFDWYFFMGSFQELISLPVCAKGVFYEMDALCNILDTETFGDELTARLQALVPDTC